MTDRSPTSPIEPADVSPPPHRTPMSRRVWTVLILLTAVVISGVACLLARASGSNLPAAVLTGGAAFAGAAGLLLAVAHYAGGE